ncbi:MAG: hypothetical protein ACRD2T_02685, partial [Thermoanaerobaculia bacterium]
IQSGGADPMQNVQWGHEGQEVDPGVRSRLAQPEEGAIVAGQETANGMKLQFKIRGEVPEAARRKLARSLTAQGAKSVRRLFPEATDPDPDLPLGPESPVRPRG